MKRRYGWDVNVNGVVHPVDCTLQGNKWVLFSGDDHIANIYRSPGTDFFEEPVMVAGKECLFVVWDERPDLVVDGMLLDRKENYAEALERRKKGFRLTYRIIFWFGIVLLILTAGYLLLNIGSADVSEVIFYVISGLFFVLYGWDKTRWLTRPANSSIISKTHDFKRTK